MNTPNRHTVRFSEKILMEENGPHVTRSQQGHRSGPVLESVWGL